MKTFLKWLNSLSSQPKKNNLTQKIREHYPEMYWECNPNGVYVSIWMKHDFFKMNIIDFMAKYLDEMENPRTSEQRANIIASVILPMYKVVTGRDYENVDLKQLIQ